MNIVISTQFWIDISQIFVTGLNLTTRPESPLKSTVGPYYPNIGVTWTPLTYDLIIMPIYIKSVNDSLFLLYFSFLSLVCLLNNNKIVSVYIYLISAVLCLRVHIPPSYPTCQVVAMRKMAFWLCERQRILHACAKTLWLCMTMVINYVWYLTQPVGCIICITKFTLFLCTIVFLSCWLLKGNPKSTDEINTWFVYVYSVKRFS